MISNAHLQWEVWSVKAQSYHHCAVWNVFLPKQQTQSLITQNQTILSALHILQTQLLPYTEGKFLGFPTPFPSTCNKTVPWSALPWVSCPDPTVPRVDQMWAELSNTSISRCAWLKSRSAFSRAHKNKQNKSSHTMTKLGYIPATINLSPLCIYIFLHPPSQHQHLIDPILCTIFVS